MEKNYVTPDVEVIDVMVEKGFGESMPIGGDGLGDQ